MNQGREAARTAVGMGAGGQDRACVRPAAAAAALPLPPRHPPLRGHSHPAPNPRSGGPVEKTKTGQQSRYRRASPLHGPPAATGCGPPMFTPAWAHRARGLGRHAALGSGGRGKARAWGRTWLPKAAMLMRAKSRPPFCSFRCTCVSKIRAGATSYGERALMIIFAASPTCKTPNGMNTYILTDLLWQLHTGAERPFLSSQLKTHREGRWMTAEELASALLHNQI